MAGRRPSSLCLFCQSRKSVIGRRRATASAVSRVTPALEQSRALRPENDGVAFPSAKGSLAQVPHSRVEISSPGESVRKWALHSPADDLTNPLLVLDAFYQRKEFRLHILRKLSSSWPVTSKEHHKYPQSPRVTPRRPRSLVLPEANSAPIPHAVFRKRIESTVGEKAVRLILREQLLRCERPKEILRIVAVAMQKRSTALSLVAQVAPLMLVLYRSRNHVSDPDILKTINALLARFRMADLPIPHPLLQMGLKFAARARSLKGMKRYLRTFRESGQVIRRALFRAVIAKFSIGRRGLGEIRNGRWSRAQLLEVLKGFSDCRDLPPEKQYHLGTFVNRKEWAYLHGWLAVLARCKDIDELLREWELWKLSEARKLPRKLLPGTHKNMTTKTRGDLWFMEQILVAGDLKTAWRLVEECKIPFWMFRDRLREGLLNCIELAPPSCRTEHVRNAMLDKYDADLKRIESALGIQWVSVSGGDAEVGDGHHELVGDREEALEKLGSEDWNMEEQVHGYPSDDGEDTVGESEERELLYAKESGLAEDEKT